MKRDVIKHLHEMKSLQKKSHGKKGILYADEINQLYYLSMNKEHVDPFRLIWNSFDFGFIAGYHCAKNERKKASPKLIPLYK